MQVGEIYQHADEGLSLVAGSFKSCIAAYALENPEPKLFYQNKTAKPDYFYREQKYKPQLRKCTGRVSFGVTVFYGEGDSIAWGKMIYVTDANICLDVEGKHTILKRDKCFWIQWI